MTVALLKRRSWWCCKVSQHSGEQRYNEGHQLTLSWRYLHLFLNCYFISKCLKVIVNEVLLFLSEIDCEMEGIPVYKVNFFWGNSPFPELSIITGDQSLIHFFSDLITKPLLKMRNIGVFFSSLILFVVLFSPSCRSRETVFNSTPKISTHAY